MCVHKINPSTQKVEWEVDKGGFLLNGGRLDLFDQLRSRPEFDSMVQNVIDGIKVELRVTLGGRFFRFKIAANDHPATSILISEI